MARLQQQVATVAQQVAAEQQQQRLVLNDLQERVRSLADGR